MDCYIHAKCYLHGLSVPRAIHLPAVHLPYLACKVITLYDYVNQLSLGKGGNFHISHDASLHTILSSFRTHVMLSVQQGRDS